MSSALSEAHEEAPDATNERRSRRSGRVSRKPELYIEEAPATKRKRDAADDDQIDEDEDSDEDDESEPGEEELKEQKAKARKTKAAAPKKPAAKRSKTNGTSVALPVRTAGKKGRSKKAKGVDEAVAEQVGGLYGRFKHTHTHVGIHSLTLVYSRGIRTRQDAGRSSRRMARRIQRARIRRRGGSGQLRSEIGRLRIGSFR
jgi:hypothetical protein